VLLVVSHPGVGGAIEALLRLERRYELRRVAKLADAVDIARSWPADVALVDASMLPRNGRTGLGVPALLLAASDAEGERGERALDDPRGWLAKDAPVEVLVASVERLLTRESEPNAETPAVIAIGVLFAIFVALLLVLVWIALV
jgi:DNA-binding NarL/FixJ family response regulator